MVTGLLAPVAVGLASAALVVNRRSAGPAHRLSSASLARHVPPDGTPVGKRDLLRPAAVVTSALATALLVGGMAGAVAAVLVAVVAHRVLPRPPDAVSLQERERAIHDLPLALDLLACALRAGQPPALAASLVATAVGGPVGTALTAVSRATALGSPAESVWQPLGLLPGAAAAARALARAADNGVRLADELVRSAGDLRERRAADAEKRVRRAGVLVVLPLGLCFLPAFVLVGVVPLAVGVAGSALR